jgi:hypothetical protein
VLIQCSLHRAVQAFQVFTNEGTLAVHDGKALVGVVVVEFQVVVLGMAKHGYVSFWVDS